jgi:hypothetical protein
MRMDHRGINKHEKKNNDWEDLKIWTYKSCCHCHDSYSDILHRIFVMILVVSSLSPGQTCRLSLSFYGIGANRGVKWAEAKQRAVACTYVEEACVYCKFQEVKFPKHGIESDRANQPDWKELLKGMCYPFFWASFHGMVLRFQRSKRWRQRYLETWLARVLKCMH